MEKYTIDFLPKLKGQSKFSVAYEKKEVINIQGIDLQFICFDDLIEEKSINSRPKDINDINELNAKRKK